MKHKHADNMAAYAADAQTTDKPWELWQFQRRHDGKWYDCGHGLGLSWGVDYEFRRKPNDQIINYLLAQASEKLEVLQTDMPTSFDEVRDLINLARDLLPKPEDCLTPTCMQVGKEI